MASSVLLPLFCALSLSLSRRCVDAQSTPRHWMAVLSLWPLETSSNLEWKSVLLEKGSLYPSTLRRGVTWSWTSQSNFPTNWAKTLVMHSSRSSHRDLKWQKFAQKQSDTLTFPVTLSCVLSPGRLRLRADLVPAEFNLIFISSVNKCLKIWKLTEQLTFCFVCAFSWGRVTVLDKSVPQCQTRGGKVNGRNFSVCI